MVVQHECAHSLQFIFPNLRQGEAGVGISQVLCFQCRLFEMIDASLGSKRATEETEPTNKTKEGTEKAQPANTLILCISEGGEGGL